MERRCFVVAGNEWAQIFSLMGRACGTGPQSPVWRRLHVLVEHAVARQAGGDGPVDQWPANEQTPPEMQRYPDGFDDEPTADSWEWNWSGFADNIIHAATIAVRNIGATEVVLVASPPMLDLLRRRAGALTALGAELVVVPLDPALFMSGGGGGLASVREMPPRASGAGLRMSA